MRFPHQGLRSPASPLPRRARLLAAELAAAVPELVPDAPPPGVQGASPHFCLAAARAAGGDGWMVLHLGDAVDAGYRLATGQSEALRPWGLALLTGLLRRWAGAADVDLEEPGHVLMEQYTAQARQILILFEV